MATHTPCAAEARPDGQDYQPGDAEAQAEGRQRGADDPGPGHPRKRCDGRVAQEVAERRCESHHREDAQPGERLREHGRDDRRRVAHDLVLETQTSSPTETQPSPGAVTP